MFAKEFANIYLSPTDSGRERGPYTVEGNPGVGPAADTAAPEWITVCIW